MSQSDEMITITAELRQDRENSWGVWQGDTDAIYREKLVFLPKSKCKRGDGKNEWLVPEWMAHEKGLI